jgi:hypothetical protein
MVLIPALGLCFALSFSNVHVRQSIRRRWSGSDSFARLMTKYSDVGQPFQADFRCLA